MPLALGTAATIGSIAMAAETEVPRTPAPASASAALPGGPLQSFVEKTRCFASLPRYRHEPDFRIVPVSEPKHTGQFFWFMDGEQKIGLLNLARGEIEMFRAFPPAGGLRVDYAMPEVHGWETLQGPRIAIAPWQWGWSGQDKVEGLQSRGRTLRLGYRETDGDKAVISHDFTLRFDSVLGYLWDCTFEMHTNVSRRVEYANILARGVADSRDDRKRYQKCLWTRRDGAWCGLYQNPRSMIQGLGREWAGAPPGGGAVGYVAEPDMNPFIEIVRSTPDSTYLTCGVWYDQHIIALPPEQKGDDGLYHVSSAYRFLSLPLPVAKELEDAAAQTAVPESKGDGPMGFRQGIVNDFETLVPAGTLYNGCIWGHSAKHDATIGHSGTHSLRLNGGESARPIHGGPMLHVEAGKRYRLSAWVRTRGATGNGACLRLQKQPDSPDARQSQFLTGDSEWTKLDIVFTPASGEPFAVPGLTLEGNGSAWFDDIELTEDKP